jgi:hypothetical protein
MCCLGLENKVRKEWAEDANTIAAQGWLPIKFPGRTKTTTVLGLVTLYGITTRPFEMIHERYSTPQLLQMQAMTQSRAMPYVHTLNLFLLQWPFLDIENVLLEPVAGGHDRLSTLPPTPAPPSKTIPKRDAWW